MIALIGLSSFLGAVNLTWTPIMMGDITTFVRAGLNDLPLPSEVVPLKTTETTYTSDEMVSITIDRTLSGDEDWVGIFKVGDNNDWDNVIAWNWVAEGTTALSRDMKPMPAGEYEIRLFFHNEYGPNATVIERYSFTVVDTEEIREFGTQGPYLSQVKSVKISENDEVLHATYYVDGVENLPTVIFMSGWKSNLENYDGFLTYVASLGYCVIAESERGECFSPDVYEQNLTTQLTMVRDTYHADISKLGIIGHSSGGGTVHYLMNYFKSNQIAGTNKSVVMSLDGWFPFGTTRTMLNDFDTPTLLMQFGGFDAINQEGIHPDWDDYAGEPYHHYQDPKINLAIFKLLTQENVDKEYVVLEANNNHSYFVGSYDTVIELQDFLAPVDEFLNHTLGNGDAMQLINQYDDVITNDLASEYRYYCHLGSFDFCNLDNLRLP